MRVAKYWAGVRVVWNHPEWDWPMAHTIWAGSDESEEAARAEAEARAAELRARPAGPMGDGPRPRHDQDEYGLYPRWTRPEPMTQEILDDEGERVGAVTINGYGADVLNTASLAFVDVDLARGGGGLRAALRAIFGRRAPSDDEAVARATAPLAAWIDEDPARGARVYRTAAGLRYMILRPPMDPRSGESDGLMRALGADPMYRRLCRIQGSFRARLSPKPWAPGARPLPRALRGAPRQGPGSGRLAGAVPVRLLRARGVPARRGAGRRGPAGRHHGADARVARQRVRGRDRGPPLA